MRRVCDDDVVEMEWKREEEMVGQGRGTRQDDSGARAGSSPRAFRAAQFNTNGSHYDVEGSVPAIIHAWTGSFVSQSR